MQETWETWVWSLGQEDPLEEEMTTHSSILAWRIPWTEESGRLQSTGSQKVRHNWSDLAHYCLYSLYCASDLCSLFSTCCKFVPLNTHSYLPHPHPLVTVIYSVFHFDFLDSITWLYLSDSPQRACVCAKLLQSCPTLCDPMDCSQPGSSLHEILQAREQEGVAIFSSRGSSWPSDWAHVSYTSCIGRQVLYH